MEYFADGLAILTFPVLMLLCGLIMGIAGRPQKYRWWAGYRMPRACINQETWVFANRYFGKLSMLGGCTTLPFSIGIFIHIDYMYDLIAWTVGAQVVSFVLSFLFTEMALRKEFDRNGERKVNR